MGQSLGHPNLTTGPSLDLRLLRCGLFLLLKFTNRQHDRLDLRLDL